MPYQTIEQLGDRGYEKISMFLTVQNLFGIAACVLPGLALIEVVSNLVMRTIILVLLATFGYLLTTEMNGMAPYQRVLWRLRGTSRGLLRGRTLAPEHLPGTAPQSHISIDWSGSIVRRKTAVTAATAESLPVGAGLPSTTAMAHKAIPNVSLIAAPVVAPVAADHLAGD